MKQPRALVRRYNSSISRAASLVLEQQTDEQARDMLEHQAQHIGYRYRHNLSCTPDVARDDIRWCIDNLQQEQANDCSDRKDWP